MFLGVCEILRATSIRHRGQTKIDISVRAGISIREVARELEEDMELDSRMPGAEGELTTSAHVTYSYSTQPRPPTVGGAPRRRRPLGRPRPAPSCQPLRPAPSSPPTSARGRLQPRFADSCSPLRAAVRRFYHRRGADNGRRATISVCPFAQFCPHERTTGGSHKQ